MRTECFEIRSHLRPTVLFRHMIPVYRVCIAHKTSFKNNQPEVRWKRRIKQSELCLHVAAIWHNSWVTSWTAVQKWFCHHFSFSFLTLPRSWPPQAVYASVSSSRWACLLFAGKTYFYFKHMYCWHLVMNNILLTQTSQVEIHQRAVANIHCPQLSLWFRPRTDFHGVQEHVRSLLPYCKMCSTDKNC